jgi:hypothetical protein
MLHIETLENENGKHRLIVIVNRLGGSNGE